MKTKSIESVVGLGLVRKNQSFRKALMSLKSKTLSIVIFLSLSLFAGRTFFAQVVHSTQSGNWSDPGTWQGGIIPSDMSAVIIAGGTCVQLDMDVNPATIEIHANASLIQNTDGVALGNSNFIASILVRGTLIIGDNCVAFPCLKVNNLVVDSMATFLNSASNASALSVKNFTVKNYGKYVHNAHSTYTNGLMSDFPGSNSIQLQENSNVHIAFWATNNAVPPVCLPPVPYGNLTIDVSNTYSEAVAWHQKGALNNVRGKLVIKKTGLGAFVSANEFIFNTETSNAMVTIGGDLSLELPAGHQVNLSRGGSTNSSQIKLKVLGNYYQEEGILNLGSNQTTGSLMLFGDFTCVGGQISAENDPDTRIAFIKTSDTLHYFDHGSVYQDAILLEFGDGNIPSTVSLASALNAGPCSILLNPDCTLLCNNFNIIGEGSLTVLGELLTSGEIQSGQIEVEGILTSSNNISQSNGVLTIYSGGVLDFSEGILQTKGEPCNIDVYGTLNLGNGTITLGSTVSGGTLTLQTDGVLNLATGLVNEFPGLEAYFTSEIYSTLMTASPDGITSSGTYGSIQVSGNRNFASEAYYVYNASVNQYTGTGLPATVLSLTSENSGTSGNNILTLSNMLSVSESLNLTRGLIHTSNQEIYVLNPAEDAISGASDSSYIIGKLRRNVNATASYDFYVGTEQEAQMATLILNNQDGVGNIAASFSDVIDGNDPYADSCQINGNPLTNMLDAGLWTLEADAEMTDGNYTVLLHEKAYSNGGQAANSHGIIKRSDVVSDWKTEGFHTDATQSEINGVLTAQCSMLTSFGQFAIAFGPVILGEGLTSFSGTAVPGQNTLTWTSSSENQLDFYEIESSLDGSNFQKIGEQDANGSTSSELSYYFSDKQPGESLTYYRLRLLNQNGQSSFSETIALTTQKEANTLISVYPNPCSDKFQLKLNACSKKGLSGLRITDETGREVYTQVFEKPLHETTIDTQDFGDGFYYLTILSSEGISSEKISVTRSTF